jgi:hypothetical protein
MLGGVATRIVAAKKKQSMLNPDTIDFEVAIQAMADAKEIKVEG